MTSLARREQWTSISRICGINWAGWTPRLIPFGGLAISLKTARSSRISFDLRLRLLTSYIVLILVTLGVITLALMILIGNRAAPPEPTYERLAALTQGLNYIDFIADIPIDPDRQSLQDQVRELLDVFSSTRNVRILHVRLTQDRTIVHYDSAQRFQPREFIRLHRDKYKSEQLARVLSRGSNQFFGRFKDPGGREWLYGAVVFGQQRFFAGRGGREDLWILAEPRPTVSLQQTLSVFSSALAPPLVQAGIAGFAFAIMLAALTSRNIARPLQRVAEAATAVARGDYSAQVPVSGPPEARSLASSFNRNDSRSAGGQHRPARFSEQRVA